MSPPALHPRTCLIRHLPDPEGPPAHFDWLVGPLDPGMDSHDPDRRDVLAWRISIRPDRLAIGQEVDLEAIAPHRRIWLDRPEGRFHDLRAPLGRAMVILRGRILWKLDSETAPLELKVAWSESDEVHRLRVRSEPGGSPRLLRLATDLSDPSASGDCSC